MQYNLLLKQVKSIIDLYEKHAELSGERFNIFSIMGMDSDEVRTHSAILGELLNPKGNHSLGSKPLELFVKQVFEENDDFELDYESSICEKELHIGKINEDKTEGGRVDLILKDTTGCKFVIENKIYAPEQTNQLKRYKTAYPEAKILYLTLEGDESKAQDDVDYQIISYKEDILNWIESCAKEAFDKPMVREVLNQYAYLIRTLTNQTTNEKMSNEIIKIIKDNYQESLEIFNNFQDARINIVSDILKGLDGKKIEFQNDNSVWNLKIDDSSKIWNIKNYKTILISNQEDSNVFFYVRYRYSSPKLTKGIVSKSLELLKGTGLPINRKDNSIYSEIMTIVGRNDLIDEFQKNPTSFIELLIEEIRLHIEKNKDYFNEIKSKIHTL